MVSTGAYWGSYKGETVDGIAEFEGEGEEGELEFLGRGKRRGFVDVLGGERLSS